MMHEMGRHPDADEQWAVDAGSCALSSSVMWIAMMVAMMLPSAAPMVLFHAAIHGVSARREPRLRPPRQAPFVLGYLAMWSGLQRLRRRGAAVRGSRRPRNCCHR